MDTDCIYYIKHIIASTIGILIVSEPRDMD